MRFCLKLTIAGLLTCLSTPLPAAERPLAKFAASYCADCHDAGVAEGDVNLSPVSKDAGKVNTDLLQRVFDAVALGEMPPRDAEQPMPAERQAALDDVAALMSSRGVRAIDKRPLPGYGNYVDHAALFREPEVRKAATPARLWRLSPHLFMQRANTISRSPLLRPQRNQGGDGLHPAFAYMTPPHTFRDHAELHAFEEATTELLFDVCWQIAGIQCTSPRSAGVIKNLLEMEQPEDAAWRRVVVFQHQQALRRRPSDEELTQLLKLANKTAAETSSAEALQTVLAAVLLKPEAVYRFEVGEGRPDQYGRVLLSPYETMHAISYTLTDQPPDAALQEAAAGGKLHSREAVRRHVQRLLNDSPLSTPRLVRFFQEYFEYPRAKEVFKDARRANAIFDNERIKDADAFVENILHEDRDVLQRLLTDEELYVMANGMPRREPPERRARKFYLPDFGFPPDWQWQKEQPVKPPRGRRSGMLTHPAWLLAFSDNEKNQAIQRGRWVRTKLLGGTVPDTPIGVDAKLPDDPHLTLREKMRVTRQEYCWRCHRRMDPLGLPFEQFDDFGRYRETELDRPVDTRGEIAVGDPEVDGPVDDPFEMLQRLANSERVEQVFVRHAFRYFLGRNETLDDAPTLIDAHRAYRDGGGSMKALVASLLTSDSFLYRRRDSDAVAKRSTQDPESDSP